MQDKFACDIHDFGKFGLLRQLCLRKFAAPDFALLRLGVVWYFVNGAPAQSNRFLRYLGDGGEFRICDPELFDALGGIVKRNRTVEELEKTGRILPRRTIFVRDPVPHSAGRENWLNNACEKVKPADVVFLDPDTGMMRHSNGPSQEHAYWAEAASFWKRGHSLVIYQHPIREKHMGQKNRAKTDARCALSIPENHPVFILRFQRGGTPFFIMIPQVRHRKQFQSVIDAMIRGEWGRHFSQQFPS